MVLFWGRGGSFSSGSALGAPGFSFKSGRDARVDFRVVEMGDFSEMLGHIKALHNACGVPVLFVVDCKCAAVAKADASMSEHFRVPVPRNLLREVLQLVLGDPVKEERGSEDMLLQKHDVLLVLAGHARATEDHVKKELGKLLKKQSVVCPRRGVVEVRLLYHQREFSMSGVYRPKRVQDGVHNALPDPLENLFIVKSRETTLNNRERKFLDLPGEAKSRGVGNLILGFFFEGWAGVHSRVVACAGSMQN